MSRLCLAPLLLALSAAPAAAAVCDYRPSRLVGDTVAGAADLAGGVVDRVADGGFYTLVNTTSGLTLLGTKLGAATSSTVGLIEGAGGAGGVASVVLNPTVWVPALIVVAGGAGYEATCALFVDERITEYDAVLQVMRDFQAHSDPAYFRLEENTLNPFIEVYDEAGKRHSYLIEDLYIVDGMLKHRSWGPNRRIGRVVFVPTEAEMDAAPVE